MTNPVKNIVIFGAYSAIAEATARHYAVQGARFFLVGRTRDRLEHLAADLKVRGAEDAHIFDCDLIAWDSMPELIETIYGSMKTVDLALIAHGTLPDQKLCEGDLAQTQDALNANMLSQIGLLTQLANRFEQQKDGTIAVISSVAGDRGRPSNYVYGSAKGALNIFLQGLSSRLAKSSVHVLTIKPGFVDTPMTADLPKGILWAKPEQIAADIVRAIEKRKQIVYSPWFWRYIMAIIKAIPNRIFNKINI
jgi:decaprenylphospho-beta-D-erythro-pentofuranosid-2-ulose 2-reductase